ncbi:MAG: DUF177 domain-containing protein [Anaerolineae bacterium]|nr:DUF177 domain-containing protein [Anaerolineae bacterium]
MIQVNLSSLVNAEIGQRKVVVLDLDNLVVGDLYLEYLQGEITFTRVAKEILTRANLDASVQVDCTRCLESFFQPVIIELDDTIGLPGAELSPENPVRVTDDGWADLAPLIRECAWLSLPLNPVCSVDCQGLCLQCGGNLNQGACTCSDYDSIDPRWDALKVLLNNQDEE